MEKAKDVDSYISTAPKHMQPKLKQIRSIIKKIAPKAQEKTSYGMPYYGYNGRLAYFAYAKAHIGLYIPPPVIKDYKKYLKAYQTSKATVRFPLDEPLPIVLIKKLIKARMKLNEAKHIR